MGRILSDGVSDAYIQDLVVLPEYRGRGIGKELVQRLVAHCRKANLTWIALVAEPGTEGFYQSLGFTSMIGYVPMRLERPD
jgi:ribosomal protein S18 acetylase RimI-like enzyme